MPFPWTCGTRRGHLEDFEKTKDVARGVTGAGTEGFRSGATFQIRRRARDAGAVAQIQRADGNSLCAHSRFPKTNDCDDSRLLHRRRVGIAVSCDMAHLRGQCPLSRCRRRKLGLGTLSRAQAADRRGRRYSPGDFSTARQFERRGGTHHGSCQSCRYRRPSSIRTSRITPIGLPARSSRSAQSSYRRRGLKTRQRDTRAWRNR